MTVARTATIVATAKQAGGLGDKTYVLVAPRDKTTGELPAPPYQVIQPAEGTETQERFTGAKATAHPRYVFHVVGSSYANAMSRMEDVKAQFIDPVTKFPYPINVAGERAYAITWEASMPVQVDTDVTPPLIYATAELSWAAEPIPPQPTPT